MSTATTILGKQVVEIQLNGMTMPIELRPLSIRQLLEFCQDMIHERRFELVLLCTGKPAEWIDQLSPESFGKLYNAALTANFEKATPMIQADPTLAVAMLPLVRKMQMAALQILSETGNDSSPEPSPLASAEAIGSASSTSAPPASLQSFALGQP